MALFVFQDLELLDTAKFIEFYLKMKKDYSTNHPSHIKIKVIFSSPKDGLLLLLRIFTVWLRRSMEES